MNIIDQIEAEEVARLTANKKVPDFNPGDTLKVMVRVTEGNRERLQAYEGVCIARAGAGYNENFTVRKISYGEGVERVFPIYSPLVDSIEVIRRGKVRRAKLYYMRDRRGKSARITERTDNRAQRMNETVRAELDAEKTALRQAREAEKAAAEAKAAEEDAAPEAEAPAEEPKAG